MEGTHMRDLPGRIIKAVSLLLELLVLILQCMYFIAESVYLKFFSSAEKSVKDEIVLITGAGRGIGKELALQYAALGATIVCWGVSREKNLDTVKEISRLGYPKAFFYECDVSDYRSVMETAKKVQQEVGDVTILINNAGIGIVKPLLQQTYSDIANTLNINMMSHFWTIQAFLPAMIKLNHGHIVANSSVAGLIGFKNGPSYCASKFAVRGMMESLYQELRLNPSSKIKITTIYPYLVKTEIFKKALLRFPDLMPVLDAPYVAKEIISAQRRDVYELSVPKYHIILNNVSRLFPMTVGAIIYDFFGVSIEE